MQKRVLITGVNGFAGGHLAPYLEGCGYEVIGTTHDSRPEHGAKWPVHVADLRDFAQIDRVVKDAKPTHVVHLAAISFVGHDDVRQIYETNIVGSRNLLQSLAMLDTRPEAVLLSSSANIYGNTENHAFRETDGFKPANDYAVSKVAMELMARQFADQLNIIIARPFNYTGVGQAHHFLIPKIVEHFRTRAPFVELGVTDISRDFSDVRMVVEYLYRLLEVPRTGDQVYNICTGLATSLQEVIAICERLTGHRLEVRVKPALVRSNEIKILVGNPDKLHETVGRTEGFNIEATLDWMLNAPF